MEVEGSLHSMIVIAVIAVLAVDVAESLSVLNFVVWFEVYYNVWILIYLRNF
jgi:hypothetical protein